MQHLPLLHAAYWLCLETRNSMSAWLFQVRNMNTPFLAPSTCNMILKPKNRVHLWESNWLSAGYFPSISPAHLLDRIN